MGTIWEIKKRSIKESNIIIFALGFDELTKSKILETNKKEFGNIIQILGNEKKELKENYKFVTAVDTNVILINLNNPNTGDKKILKELFQSGYKMIVFSEKNLMKEEFIEFYKQDLEGEISGLELIYGIN